MRCPTLAVLGLTIGLAFSACAGVENGGGEQLWVGNPAGSVPEAERFASQADAARSAGDVSRAIELVTRAIDLLPPASKRDAAVGLDLRGQMLSEKAEVAGDQAGMERASADFRQALALLSRAEDPTQWAAAQQHLGRAQMLLGVWRGREANLEAAIVAYRASLDVWTREQFAANWATSKALLGLTLSQLGAARRDPALLREAAATQRAALSALDRAAKPKVWATVQTDLATTLSRLADHLTEQERAQLSSAIAQSNTRRSLPRAAPDTEVAQVLGPHIELLSEAEAGYAAALAVLVQGDGYWRRAQDGAATARMLHAALELAIGEYHESARLLREAIHIYESNPDLLDSDQGSFRWAITQNNYGMVLLNFAQFASRVAGHSGPAEAPSAAMKAIKAFRAALSVFEAQGNDANAATVRSSLTQAERLLLSLSR